MYPSNVTPEKLQAEKERVKALWIERNAQHNNRYAESQRSLTYSLAHANSLGRYGSLLWQEYDGVANAVPSTWPVEVLVGQQYCTEVLFGLRYLNANAMAAVVAVLIAFYHCCRFRVSPNAFFQINTAATEILYGIVRNWCAPTADSILIGTCTNVAPLRVCGRVLLTRQRALADLCCGTGTIGLSMASQVKQVIGVDMVEDAIVDARYNAEQNNITNATFIASKAEAVAASLMAEYGPQGACIGVVDPPRPGLRTKRLSLLSLSLSLSLCFSDSSIENGVGDCVVQTWTSFERSASARPSSS